MKVKDLFDKLLGFMLVLMALSYVILLLVPNETGDMVISVLIIFIFLVSLPSLRGVTRIIILSLLILGVALMIISEAKVHYWMEGVRVNLTLVTIFIFTPLLGIPIKTGNYIKSLQIVFSSIKDDARFLFIGLNLLTHILGVILNIGAVSISFHLSKLSKIKSPELIANSINRGFTSTIYWSPYFSAMLLIISHLKVTWISIVFYSLGLVLISLIVSIMLDWKIIKKEVCRLRNLNNNEIINEVECSQEEFKRARKKVLELFLLLFVMMIIVLIIEALSSFSMILIICLVSIIFPIAWCFLFKQTRQYRAEIIKHIFETLPRMRKEITLFLVAGFFSAGFLAANLSTYLISGLDHLFGTFTFGIALSLVLLVVITGLIGLHPVVLITIFVTSINPELIGFSKEYFAILLLTSWGIANNLSPATVVNNLLANLLKVKVTDISINWNFKYVLIMTIILPVYLTILKI